MNTLTLLGYLAAICTTISFVPQVVRVWRTRSAEDISGWMYGLFITGLVLWLAYGVALQAWPIIIGNTITLGLAGSVLVMKFRFARRQGLPR